MLEKRTIIGRARQEGLVAARIGRVAKVREDGGLGVLRGSDGKEGDGRADGNDLTKLGVTGHEVSRIDDQYDFGVARGRVGARHEADHTGVVAPGD